MSIHYSKVSASSFIAGVVLAAISIFMHYDVACAQSPGYGVWKHMRTVDQQGYVCYRTPEPIVTDGKMDEPSWDDVPWTNYFLDIEGLQQPIPRFKTRAKMMWDDTYFYFGFYLEEPHVWGTLLWRDQVICLENDIEIFIDPNSDSHEYYEIEIGPLNTVWDLFLNKAYRDGTKVDHAWNLEGMKTGVHVYGTINDPRDIDEAWTVEVAIPWSDLAEYAHRPSPPRHDDQWRVNFSRVEYLHAVVNAQYSADITLMNAYERRDRPGRINCDNWSWSDQGVCAMHCPEMWGFVQFSMSPPGTDTYRPDPMIPARKVMFDIYYMQHDYRAEFNRYAKSLKQLGYTFEKQENMPEPPKFETTEDGFHASIKIDVPYGTPKIVHIRQDSKIWVE